MSQTGDKASTSRPGESGESEPDDFWAPDIPKPILTYDFRMRVQLNPKIAVGIVPSGGIRNWISFSGGSWRAGWGRGTVVPGGQDSQVVDENYVVRMETMYLLKTDDEDPA
ncbi:hypothetical protein GGS20DRAFT_194992 [Poronia punctata]|nr:hypothetical protein GGS20DRAFT_194992 [Poronia punctata]